MKLRLPIRFVLIVLFQLVSVFAFAQTVGGTAAGDDFDGDGIINSVDIDDDNDGVPDLQECNPSAKRILFAGSNEDFSTMRSSLFNEFNNNKASGATIVESNIIESATVPAGFYDGYDMVIFGGAAFYAIHPNHWAALTTAIQNKTSKSFVIQSDNCCVAGNQSGLVNLLNTVFGTNYSLSNANAGTNEVFPLNQQSSYANLISTTSLSGNNYYPMLNVAVNDILFYSPTVSGSALAGMKQLPGTTDKNRFVAWFVDGTPTQGAPWYPTNQNKIAPAFYDAFYGSATLDCDQDNDGVYNVYDLDSDGDNCPDAKEAGVSGTLRNGDLKNGSNGSVTSTTSVANAIAGNSNSYGTNGLADAIETVAGNGIINYVSSYTNYALSGSDNVCSGVDTDADGIIDIFDLDDDNDGILDSVEGYSCVTLSTNRSQLFTDPTLKRINLIQNGGFDQGNTGFTTTYTYGNLGQCGAYTVAPTGWVSSVGSLSEGNALQVNAECAGAFSPFWSQTVVVKPNTNYKLGFSIRQANFARVSFRINGGAAQGNFGTTAAWVTHESIINSGSNSTLEIGLFEATGAPSSADFTVDDIYLIEVKDVNCTQPLDTDNDGIFNHLDLDSDGDGCTDAVEAGVTGTLNSGVVKNGSNGAVTSTNTLANAIASGAFGTNGLANNLEITADNGVVNYTPTYSYATMRSYATCADADNDNILDRIISLLAEYPQVNVKLQGHTDYRQTEQYNEGLAERRVASVRRYLMQRGVNADRFKGEAFSELVPASKTDLQLNRRVEVHIWK